MLHLALALAVFYVLHSLLAWTGVKRWVHSVLGLDRWYRLVYTALSLLLFAWVYFAYTRAGHCEPFWAIGPPVIIFGWSLVVLGACLAAAAVLRFGGMAFLGLAPEERGTLVRSGLHGRVRHPIYSGSLLSLVGWLCLSPNWPTVLSILITVLYLPIGIHLEELKLIADHGDAYRRYRDEVPALVPRWHTKEP
ncbi:MAG: isoprenylcysteine carboxylmethyltransferase family protein [Flavobacteriales bacterium]|nr:isoprenylcysteine carboxylmethyltransferase family protein [Flavobacteriales bacterium]